MKKDLHEEKEQFDRKSNENLAAAYNILRDLSDDEFESWLEGGNVSPAKYEEAERKFLSQPISEKIADLKRRAAARTHPSFAPAAWLEDAKAELPKLARAIWSKVVSFGEIDDEPEAELAPVLSATSSKLRREKSVRLPGTVRQRLPWTGEKLRIKAKQSQEDSQKNTFLVFVDVRRNAPKAGELGVAIKFKSNDKPIVIFLKSHEASKPIGSWPDNLQELEIQLFIAPHE
jgi:hypothetical protein